MLSTNFYCSGAVKLSPLPYCHGFLFSFISALHHMAKNAADVTQRSLTWELFLY